MVSFQGAVFDVDGVLLDTPHERAWRDTLRDLMEHEWRDVQPQTSYRRSASRRPSTRSA